MQIEKRRLKKPSLFDFLHESAGGEGSADGAARGKGGDPLEREWPAFSHGCEGGAACAPRHQRGYSLFEENTPFESPRERQGASPSTPDIAGLVLEELHALRSVGAVYMASP